MLFGMATREATCIPSSTQVSFYCGKSDSHIYLQSAILIDRNVQNCKWYNTANNEFSFSISLQDTQQKFSGNFYRKMVYTETVTYHFSWWMYTLNIKMLSPLMNLDLKKNLEIWFLSL